MGVAVITLVDNDDTTDVQVLFEPALNDGAGTPAQMVALKMLDAVATPEELDAAIVTNADGTTVGDSNSDSSET